LPLVYDELRKRAAHRLAQQAPGQTLQPTALVHEAYLRFVGDPKGNGWDNGGHFFAAAAEAMRRILVENARRKGRLKRGGNFARRNFEEAKIVAWPDVREDLVALDETLTRLASLDSQAAQLVPLHYFAGLSIPEATQNLGVSPRTADRLWAFARAWLLREIAGEAPEALNSWKNGWRDFARKCGLSFEGRRSPWVRKVRGNFKLAGDACRFCRAPFDNHWEMVSLNQGARNADQTQDYAVSVVRHASRGSCATLHLDFQEWAYPERHPLRQGRARDSWSP
jgi:RNA polymerase sigma factor (TIGR02999 family)